jgi:hypothetical protein
MQAVSSNSFDYKEWNKYFTNLFSGKTFGANLLNIDLKIYVKLPVSLW